MRELIMSLSKDKGDFVVTPFKGSGKGGQKRNKTMSACRITHPASGAVSECQEGMGLWLKAEVEEDEE